MWQNLDAHIGEVTRAKETDEGLYVKAQLDMQDPAAAKVFRLMKPAAWPSSASPTTSSRRSCRTAPTSC
jgi:hypothetical protein